MANSQGGFESDIPQRSRRRRFERASSSTALADSWIAPHVIKPRPQDEKIVVTERWVYRPKKQSEEQRRQEELHDYSMRSEEATRFYHDNWGKDREVPTRTVRLNEEASRYYQDDWAKDRERSSHSVKSDKETSRCLQEDWASGKAVHSADFREQRRPRSSISDRYRRDFIQDYELAESENTDYYRARNLSRTPR
jgi:hypothetical protein